MKMVLLVDMDYFYVACEELRHPEIKGVPAVVGMDPKGGAGRGVVMTCNYEAREFGIKSGMPISMAYRIKPDAVYLPLDYDYYDRVSAKVMAAIKPLAGKFEQVSVDEAYMDVSGKIADASEALGYAKIVQKRVLDDVGMKCSIGIGPNKLMAKMACESAKPAGIKQVKDEEVGEFLKDMEVGKLYGVGDKTAEKLRKLGYRTVGHLSKANIMRMMELFGAFGPEMVRSAKGIDERDVVENYGVKSIGREFTFDSDTYSSAEIEARIAELGRGVIVEVAKGRKSFKTIILKLRYGDFTEHLHSKSIKVTDSQDMLISTAVNLYRQNADRSRKIRKIGVRVSNLVDYRGQRKIV